MLSTETKSEVIPTSPVFPNTEKKEEQKSDEESDEQLLEQAVLELEEMGKEIATAKENETKAIQEKDAIAEELKKNTERGNEIENAWQKVAEHPIIGKLVEDLIKGIEIDIPKILQDKVKEDAASMADISSQSPVSIEEKPISLTKRMAKVRLSF